VNREQWEELNRDKLIEHGGRVWLPVEITLPHGGFWNAVGVGAREYEKAGDEARLYPMGESWAVYRSVSIPGAGDRLPEMPEEEKLIGAFEKEMGTGH
jgi:hypothetical protein